MSNRLLEILRGDVKPALGCTGPIAVAFAACVAAKAVGGKLQSIEMTVDRDTYKNCVSVVTPGTNYRGVMEAAVLGALYGDPDLGLEALQNLEYFDKELVEEIANNRMTVNIAWQHKTVGLYIDVTVHTALGVGHAIVARTHDGVVLKEANGVVLERDPSFSRKDKDYEEQKPIRLYTVRDVYDFCMGVETESLDFLKEAVRLNYQLAEAGLKEHCGSMFGQGLSAIGDASAYSRAKILAAAASDARMSGVALPAMSCGGSGNVGITGAIPLLCIAEELGIDEPKLLRAVAMSYLLIIMVKAHIGRLSPLCACSLAAGIGVTAGACLLMDGSFEQIEGAINTLVGSIGGVLCDGAKFSCAMKLATGAGVAIECAKLAKNAVYIQPQDGLACKTADETIALIGRLARKGMWPADEEMCREIIRRDDRIYTEIPEEHTV